jgi:nitrogen fixation protein FixH
MTKEIKGIHVLGMFIAAFSVIITVNLTLAYQAVHTFPGLEVKNSYVASQKFDVEKADQLALNWDVSATLEGNELALVIVKDGVAIAPRIEQAIFGRATSVKQDQTPDFAFDGKALRARVVVNGGNWNLRLKMRSEDGTLFQQRVVVKVIR